MDKELELFRDVLREESCEDCGSLPSLSLHRRSFLRAAALGVAYVALPKRKAWGLYAPSASQPVLDPADGLAAFDGTLVEIGESWLDIQLTPDEHRRVPIGSSSTFWKGPDGDLSSFTLGDDVLVRTLNDTIDRAWSNLVRVKGVVSRSRGRDFVLEEHDPDHELHREVDVRVPESARKKIPGQRPLHRENICSVGCPTSGKNSRNTAARTRNSDSLRQ